MDAYEPEADEAEVLRRAATYLLKLPEHTWGLSDLYNKSANWTNAKLREQLAAGDFDANLRDWEAQRDFARLAAEALPEGHALRGAWDAILADAAAGPSPPDLSAYRETRARAFACRGVDVRFDGRGALVLEKEGLTLGALTYEALGEDVYNTSEFVCDQVFGGKPGSAAYAGGATARSEASLASLHAADDGCAFVAALDVDGVGAPDRVFAAFDLRRPGAVDVDVSVFGKVPTRFNEAAWLRFEGGDGTWTLTKLGSEVPFDDVVRGGSSGVHAADAAVLRRRADGTALAVDSFDAPVLAPIADRPPSVLLNYQEEPATDVTGVAFNLWNNAWSTNYMFFYPYLAQDANFSYHFAVAL